VSELALRATQLRKELPNVISAAAAVVVDNPAPVALSLASGVVLGKVLMNLAKPRGLIEVAAVVLVTQAATAYLMNRGLQDGWLALKVRDSEGNLVPLDWPEDWR
jgi:hypothetical protein